MAEGSVFIGNLREKGGGVRGGGRGGGGGTGAGSMSAGAGG